MNILLIVVLILLLAGSFGTAPIWHYSSSWGYGPSGSIGIILIVLLVLAILGKI